MDEEDEEILQRAAGLPHAPAGHQAISKRATPPKRKPQETQINTGTAKPKAQPRAKAPAKKTDAAKCSQSPVDQKRRKNVYSRAYHARLSECQRAGVAGDEARQQARAAGLRACSEL